MRTTLVALLLGVVLMSVSEPSLAEPLETAKTPRPGEQVAKSLVLPANQNQFIVDGNRIELSEQPLHETETEEVRYWIYLPNDYTPSGEPVPVLLFLHGAGERGNDIEMVKKHGPPRLCEQQADWPFLTISPQCPSGRWWSAKQLQLLLDAIDKEYRIDNTRIYVTGLSMGGFGTWGLAADNASRFAAAVPICGGGETESAPKMVDLPIWAFHGDADFVVPPQRTTEMVDAIRAAGGDKVKLTVYPGVGHDSWTATYANPEVYRWLLSHRREKKAISEATDAARD